MCGIIGTIGTQNTLNILLNGLKKLEYRGYDSAGVFIADEQTATLQKIAGRIRNLKESLDENITGHIGIGHTRWATHGLANTTNAHPHLSNDKRFVLVHNGVINNSEQLKKQYLANIDIASDTDSEVIVQLIALFAQTLNTKDAIVKTLKLLEGSYALGIIDTEDCNTLYAAKHKSPLLIGQGTNANYIASDAMALLDETNHFIEIMDEELVTLTKDTINIENLQGDTITRQPYISTIDASDSELGNYEHFMLKEIEEQPAVIRNLLKHYSNQHNELTLPTPIINEFNHCDRIYIIACGTSYHAGLIGKKWLEKFTHIPVEVHIASEFAYFTPQITKKPLFLFISQSGETADSRRALKNIQQLGTTIVLTNVDNSTLVRETDGALLLHAGPEIAVASTKAYTAQLTVLAIIAKVIGELTTIEGKEWNLINELSIVAQAMDECITEKQQYKDFVQNNLTTTTNAFFLGRGKDYDVALEAALKLKEISYIQAEGYAAGELKHGPIALISKGTPVILLNSELATKDHLYSNGQEVQSRGANVLTIATQKCSNNETDVIVPDVDSNLTPLVLIIVCQYIAYYTACLKNLDVDKPRNLAKSVTVE